MKSRFVIYSIILILLCSVFSLGQKSNTQWNSYQTALEYRNSLERTLASQRNAVRVAAETYRNKRELADKGKAERWELDDSRRALEDAEATVRKTKKEIWSVESEYHLLPLQSPASGSNTDQMEPELKVVSLDAKDKDFISDAINELTRITYTMAVTAHRHRATLNEAKKLMLPYCKCTMAQYEDYLAGNGLPSVINQMDHSNIQMSSSDIRLSRYLSNKMDALLAYQKSQRELYDSTVTLAVTRLTDFFVKQGGRYIEGYVFNIEQMQFIPLVNHEQAKSLDAVIRDYMGTHIGKLSKQETSRIIDSVIRQEQKREGITPKPQRPQKGKPTRKPSAKTKTPVRSI